jgi:hypothetical protein
MPAVSPALVVVDHASVTVTPGGTRACGRSLVAGTSFAYPLGVPDGTPEGTSEGLTLGWSLFVGGFTGGGLFVREWRVGEGEPWGVELAQAPARTSREMAAIRNERTG